MRNKFVMKCDKTDCYGYMFDGNAQSYCNICEDRTGLKNCPFFQSKENYVKKVIALDSRDYQRAMELSGTKTLTIEQIKDWIKRAEELDPTKDAKVKTKIEKLMVK